MNDVNQRILSRPVLIFDEGNAGIVDLKQPGHGMRILVVGAGGIGGYFGGRLLGDSVRAEPNGKSVEK